MHGIPSPTRVLADGDLISVDCGAVLDGWHGDAAITIPVGDGGGGRSPAVAACEAALSAGIAAALPERAALGHLLRGAVVDRGRGRAQPADYGIVAEYGGHGIGTAMHMDPFLPNHGDPGHGPRLRPGMALAIEPMITAGDPETVELEDGWTVVTASGARAVHWEHSVAITDDGPRVLTLPA